MADESQCFRSPPPHPPDFAVLSFACGEFLPKPLPSDLVNEDHPHLGKHVIENLHLDHRLSVVTSEGHKVRRQKLLYCHLCGRQFGSASIAIHYRACGRKLQTAMSQHMQKYSSLERYILSHVGQWHLNACRCTCLSHAMRLLLLLLTVASSMITMTATVRLLCRWRLLSVQAAIYNL